MLDWFGQMSLPYVITCNYFSPQICCILDLLSKGGGGRTEGTDPKNHAETLQSKIYSYNGQFGGF